MQRYRMSSVFSGASPGEPGRRAFTLIELLVVIAIIAILAALLFPVYTRSRDRAIQTQCVSDLRQLGQGVLLYRQDFDDRFPYAIDYMDRQLIDTWRSWDQTIPNASTQVQELASRTASDGSPYGGQIDRVLRPWTTSEEIWRCPGDTGAGGVGAATATDYTKELTAQPVWRITRGSGTWGGTSYMYRTELCLSNRPASRLRYPSLTNVFMDAAFYWHSRLHRAPRPNSTEWADYSQGSYDQLYADGHAANVSQQDYSDSWWLPYRNASGVNTWTPFE
ncbi:MAG TPA: prepilin-type N-terminal cleavage/methylation domain-containing protein [Armatimonadota bacterium]|jgi:general secretion pathway protein G